MLARTAEHLFWAGRYLERAESTARLLDVTYHHLLEMTPAEEREGWAEVLEAVALDQEFRVRGEPLRAGPVADFLVADLSNPGSIVSSVARARENARGVREHLAMELWEALNRLHLSLSARDLAYDLVNQPHELYGFVRQGIQGVFGVAHETWAREDSWRFFMLGLFLERAETAARTLRVRQPRHQSDPAHAWSVTLRSASALQAYRRLYQTPDVPAIVELLLLSPTLPRSVLFCLSEAEEVLGALVEDGASGRSLSLRLLGRVRAELEYADPAELAAGDLCSSLGDIERGIRDVAAAVAAECFSYRIELDLHSLRLAPRTGAVA